MDPRLAGAINTPGIQRPAGELIRLSLKALDDLKQLDESLYERFVSSRTAAADPVEAAAGLRTLWDDTFGGLLHLLAYCRSLATDLPRDQAANDAPVTFDFGDLEGDGPAAPATEESLDFGSADFGELLDGIDEQPQQGDAERWATVLEKIGSIEYGLRTQYLDAVSRMSVALGAGETNQVLGLLDDTQSSASEGVHALVAAVYEAFLPDVNAATVVPGYLTSLGRALLVRRGLAELAVNLTSYNDILQGDSPAHYADAIGRVRDVMRTFVGSVVCRAMRAADRWEMVEFERQIVEQPLTVARLTCEGLVKYLESLGSINQREVLLLHDQRTISEMHEALTNARELFDLSPRTAHTMLQRAYQSAQRLRGRNPSTDQMIVQLERYAPSTSNTADDLKFLERLEALLSASG